MKKPGRKKIAILLSILVVLLVMAVSLVIVYVRLSDLSAHKEDIVNTFKAALNRDVAYESADFSFSFGPAFAFKGIQIREKDGSSFFATMDRLEFRVALLPLLWKKIVIKEVYLDSPRLILVRNPSGLFNISDLLEDNQERQSFEIKTVTVKKGHIEFNDQGISIAGVRTIIDDVYFRIGDLRRGKKSRLDVEAAATQEGIRGKFSLKGKIRISEEETPLIKSDLDAGLLIQGLSFEKLWPYYRKHVPFEKMAGTLDVDTRLKGNIDAFNVTGSVTATSLVLDYPKVFHATLMPQKVTVECKLRRSLSEIAVENIHASIDGVKVSGNFIMKDIDKADPLISASATTTPIPLEKFGTYIPYGIIAKGVAVFIEDRIKGGTYQLLEGSLQGRVSQIAHMEKDQNYKVLHVRASVKEGRLTYGENVPVFSKISGELELKDKDFHLHQMSGAFGESPLSLEGKIADYPLTTPSTYPFSMTMTPSPKEVIWLLGKDRGEKMAFTGKSTLKLAGKGTTDQYELEGDWDLANASYRYEDIFAKRQGQSNRVMFRTALNDKEARLISGSYDLASLSMKVSGLYPFQGKRRFSLALDSNPFRIEDLETAFPVIKKWHPRGGIQMSVKTDSLIRAEEDIRWRGFITLSNFSFQPGETLKAVTGLNGTISLANNVLETSRLTGQIGKSSFYARAFLDGFSKPTLNLHVSAKLLDLNDVGLESPAGPVVAKDVTGNITWKDKGIRIESLSARINRSDLTITGFIPDLNKPYYDFQMVSSYLDTADLKFINDWAEAKKSNVSPDLTVKATIKSAEGKLQDLPYSKLGVNLTYRQQAIHVDSFRLNALEGSLSGQGRLVLAAGKQPRFQTNFEVDKISVKKTIQMAGLDPDLITGTLSMKGNLAGVGLSIGELKRTAAGTINLRMEKGSLRKFQVLSKVFSILNVSQLLKFQLPDMVSGGMPYTTITGNFSLKDGILASNDLYVKSDAMNISIIGKVDIVKEELEQTIGVQPLQTVDKVVSHIPVVGWILTNETNSMISMYFDAKGKWDNPAVQAIPVRDIAQGVFNIFRRLFQLPVKLITDTGDVILGR